MCPAMGVSREDNIHLFLSRWYTSPCTNCLLQFVWISQWHFSMWCGSFVSFSVYWTSDWLRTAQFFGLVV
jgi:hypothetical protein